MKFLSFLGVLSFSISIQAQIHSFTGRVNDTQTGEALIGVNLYLFSPKDTLPIIRTISDPSGYFMFSQVRHGEYYLKATYIGYKTLVVTLSVPLSTDSLLLFLIPESEMLNEVLVTAKQIRVEQRGDTTAYNAGAYKTNPDASAEDLVKKMPGITVENGTVQAQGEEVKTILVDGKRFFGNDPNAALKNLPADMIDKVEVFDQLSEQSRFSGFDDGNTAKTINIRTKSSMSNGYFGRVYAGYGTDNRYSSGLSLNAFKEYRKITVLGMSNNINQQNFSTEDLSGIQPSTQGFGFRRSGNSPFQIGEQSGISTAHGVGMNYTDEWGKKWTIASSYFFNLSDNINSSILKRIYFAESDTGQLIYNENFSSDIRNMNHRVNARIEWKIDSVNSLIITPAFSLQDNSKQTFTIGENVRNEELFLSSNEQDEVQDRLAWQSSLTLLYRHRFLKKGRTFSAETNGGLSRNNLEANQNAISIFEADTSLINQLRDRKSDENRAALSLSYTEPIAKKLLWEWNYKPSVSFNSSDQTTNNFNVAEQSYSLLDSALSNQFISNVWTNKGGTSLLFVPGTGVNLSIGADFQNITLSAITNFPIQNDITRNYFDVLPFLEFKKGKGHGNMFRIRYRTSVEVPSPSKLQEVVDISNPISLSAGNENLNRQYIHDGGIRFAKSNMEMGQMLFLFTNVKYIHNYIANQVFLPGSQIIDTLLGVVVPEGAQVTLPVNLQGYVNARTFLSQGYPLSFIKCNLNLTTGFTYTRSPGLINSSSNLSHSANLRQGITISSNISEKFDFTVSYNANYYWVRQSLQASANNNFFLHNAAVSLNLLPWKGLLMNTSLSNVFNTALADFGRQYTLWNVALGYKFLKDKSLEAKLSAFDLLRQNNSISRVVNENYIEDSETTVLQQYFLLTLTYTLKKFR